MRAQSAGNLRASEEMSHQKKLKGFAQSGGHREGPSFAYQFGMRAKFLLLSLPLLVACGAAPVSTLGEEEDESPIVSSNAPAPSSSSTTAPAPSGSSPTSPAPTGTTPPSTPGPGAATISATIDKGAIDLELRAKTTVVLSLMPGSSGTAILSASKLPDGVKVVFSPSTVALTAGVASTASVTIETASSVTTGAANISLDATVGGVATSVNLALNVKPMITISLPKGLSALPAGGEYGDPIVIKVASVSAAAPVKIIFKNDDTVPHQIHGDGRNGFVHGSSIPAGGSDPVRNVTAKGEISFYLHGETPRHDGMISIQ